MMVKREIEIRSKAIVHRGIIIIFAIQSHTFGEGQTNRTEKNEPVFKIVF